MKKNRETNKGITLIALVITIIVLLILAGVSISMLTGENGILKQANTAKEENRKSELKEEGKLDMNDTYIQTQQVEAYEISSTDEDFSDWATDGNGAITAYNGSLTEVVIPSKIGDEKITTVGKSGNIFGDNKSNITKVVMSKGITAINDSTFSRCNNLVKVIIPNTVTSIGYFAFDNTNILSIIIPDGVTKLDSMVLSYCSKLMEIKLPKNLTELAGNNFINSGFYELKIPNKVEKLGSCVIWDCPNVEEVYIPASVETMSGAAIGNCPNLKKVYCEIQEDEVPEGWNASWLLNCPNVEIVWGYTGI
ncbi:MAG: leucine-rich repeat domain-containing protein [Clostridia bacterium]|nr:leucine-rich repeat domain-containing protein [Clostridia bacterium]